MKHETPGHDETLATVADFSDERLARLVAAHPGARATRSFALNLEDTFVELVRAGGDTDTNTNREA